MSDIHQEWRELREKNGNFINHLDCATADYRALWVENENLKYQLAREKAEHEEKIDNAGNSYARLAIERNNLAETASNMEKMIRDLEERNKTLRKRLANVNESLKISMQESNKNRDEAAYLDNLRIYQAKEIERLQKIVNAPNGSCSTYTQQGMQSKIAKQANEIERLTDENEDLKGTTNTLSKMMDASLEDIHNLRDENKQLHNALDIAAKDAEVGFNRGRIKGMEEIWDELKGIYNRSAIENEKIFGYFFVGDILRNLSPTWFINKAEEYHEQEEKQDEDIQIGDEVEIFDTFCPDDDPHSDIGIVIAIDKDNPCFAVIGPQFEGCFDETDIENGNVKKTGRHFDSIPLDYFA